MFAYGLEEEVRALRALGYGNCDVVKNGIAYKEMGMMLDEQLQWHEAEKAAVIRTRQYAKRQRTYFRGRGWKTYTLDELNGAVPQP